MYNWLKKFFKITFDCVFNDQNEARKLNHQEVVEEDKRSKLPANFEQKRKRVDWEEEQEKKRKVNRNVGE